MRPTGAVTPNEYGLYECTGCGCEFVTPLAAALCCDTDYEGEPGR